MSQKIEVSEFGRTYRVKNYDAQRLVARAIARWTVPGRKVEILAGMSAFVSAALAHGNLPVFTLPDDLADLPPIELPGIKFEQPASANLENSIVPRLRLLTARERRAQPQQRRAKRCDCSSCRLERNASPIVASLPSVRQGDARPVL